ncbi:FAD-dependent oxidoreductase [Candidatus Woesearchaeota archaeon]|nr:FAD-dependent oxidoreductase [Candidatus Woesearchaeota archaeon]
MDQDVIIIGGGPAGLITGLAARRRRPEAKILVIKNIPDGVIPCGIPYMFTCLDDPAKNALGNEPLQKNGIGLLEAEAIAIDREKRTVTIADGTTHSYAKLVIATGSDPIVPPLPGRDKKGIYPIRKQLSYLTGLKEDLIRAKDVVVIGGGFIGIEFADELSCLEDARITIVEALPRVLARQFDDPFSDKAKAALESRGVTVRTGVQAERFEGDERVSTVVLSDGTSIPAQVVILGIGTRPNAKLALDAGLSKDRYGGIRVDEYQRSLDDPDIFAVGDCAAKRDALTGRPSGAWLASVATAEARIAGHNLVSIGLLRQNPGTVACYSTKIGETSLACAGLTAKGAEEAGFEVVIGEAESPDKHPGGLPGMKNISARLVFSKGSHRLLGGQLAGGDSVGEMVNILSLAIQKRTTAEELVTMMLATHPKLTPAPTTYPLVAAAEAALYAR